MVKTVFSMRGFGECNHGESAYNQPGACIDAVYEGGRLSVTVDCYSWLLDRGSEADHDFDVDAWERSKLVMVATPDADLRAAWYEAFRVARTLRSGRSIQVGDAQPFSLEDWVAGAYSPDAPGRYGVEYGGCDA